MNIIILRILLSICFFLLGWFGGMIYEDVNDKENRFDGLRFTADSHLNALNIAKEHGGEGTWVCSNVRNMDYNRCVEVASHECGHELFAKKCEDNPKLCFDLIKVLEDGKG